MGNGMRVNGRNEVFACNSDGHSAYGVLSFDHFASVLISSNHQKES